jgi:hypothetical protein
LLDMKRMSFNNSNYFPYKVILNSYFQFLVQSYKVDKAIFIRPLYSSNNYSYYSSFSIAFPGLNYAKSFTSSLSGGLSFFKNFIANRMKTSNFAFILSSILSFSKYFSLTLIIKLACSVGVTYCPLSMNKDYYLVNSIWNTAAIS